MAGAPFKSMQYTMQNHVEGEFKEPIHIMDYAAGKRDSPPIDLGVVQDDFLISFVIGEKDTLCKPAIGERIFNEFTNAKKTKRIEEGYDHEKIATNSDQGFLKRMLETIEDGAAYDKEKGSMWEDFFSLFMMDDGASTLLATSAVALTTLALTF